MLAELKYSIQKTSSYIHLTKVTWVGTHSAMAALASSVWNTALRWWSCFHERACHLPHPRLDGRAAASARARSAPALRPARPRALVPRPRRSCTQQRARILDRRAHAVQLVNAEGRIMARSIFRSGRVVYVWHRNVPAASGFYALVRGGMYLGPYQERHHDVSAGVLNQPRARIDTLPAIFARIARAADPAVKAHP